MLVSVLVAVSSAGCFLALAHAAVTSDRTTFLRVTTAMSAAALSLVLLSPAAGVPLLASVLFSRRLAGPAIPANLPF